MAVSLNQPDFDRLTEIISAHGDWLSVRGRLDLLADVFTGSPRKRDILAQIDVDGTPRGTAVRVIHRLASFGQDEAGRESLGVLINKLLAYMGGGEESEFLRALLERYPFTTAPLATRGVGSWMGRESDASVNEKIVGENTLRDVSMLEILLDLSHAVVRVRGPGIGTGFLIGEDLLLTNNHVISDPAVAAECVFEFNYQLDRDGREVQPLYTTTAVDGGLFHTSPVASENANPAALDYTVVQLREVPEGVRPLCLRPAPIRTNDRLAIIQHPSGGYKKISLQNNFVAYVDEVVVQYTTSTEPGSSGSPTIDDQFGVVALHHAGGNIKEPGTTHRYFRNEGIRSTAILADLRESAPTIHARIATG